MTERQIVLFDDRIARDWMPFTNTRPAGELWFGAMSLRERAERVLGGRCLGHITRDELATFDEHDAAPVLDRVPSGSPVILLCSRVVLDWNFRFEEPAGLSPLTMDGQVVGWFIPAGEAAPEPAELLELPTAQGDAIALAGRMLHEIWELMSGSSAQTAFDIDSLFPRHKTDAPAFNGLNWIGEPHLALASDVRIEPGVVFDFTSGPIWLDRGVVIRAFTRLAGPSYIGRGTTLLGGSFSGVTAGPQCKLRGELEETVVLGYSNKAHDGFMGHAYIGRWVNLGALTTNSDLKNNYSKVRVWTPGGDRNTGEKKIGCFLGDHVKTGIGSLLNTGTVIGTGSNLFGPEMPAKYVPPFCWGNRSHVTSYDLDRFLETAEIVMSRRGVQLTDGTRRVLERAWHRARAET